MGDSSATGGQVVTTSEIIRAKSDLLDRWTLGRLTVEEFGREFRALDDRQPCAWGDTWPRVVLGAALILTAAIGWAWVLR
jgi:hypothetical protein